MLEISQVTKAYRTARGEVPVLSSVSLTLAAGEVVAVKGPSGCGKTTLLLMAGGLLRPDAGLVQFEGRSLYLLPDEERARVRSVSFGFVYQQFHLLPYLSVMENILVPTLVTRRECRAKARELIEALKLEHRVHHKPSQLSIGERQRTALARALVSSPAVLLADEPTGNLDDENAAIVLDRMADFARRGGAVLVVTHDAAIAARAARTVTIEAGTLRS